MCTKEEQVEGGYTANHDTVQLRTSYLGRTDRAVAERLSLSII